MRLIVYSAGHWLTACQKAGGKEKKEVCTTTKTGVGQCGKSGATDCQGSTTRYGSLALVERHFGVAWQRFLAGQQSHLNVSNLYIRHAIAMCYEKLKSEEFLNLLQAFVSPNDRLDDYGLLHSGIYQLVLSRRFVKNDILKLLRDLPEQYHVLRLQDALAPPISER